MQYGFVLFMIYKKSLDVKLKFTLNTKSYELQ